MLTDSTLQYIPGAVGRIALKTVFPPPTRSLQGILCVVCHPHPLYGGTMENKVVTTLANTLKELGIVSVLFNFRGVGASEGVFDGGGGELEDLLKVIEWVKGNFPEAILWLGGFSFGASIALQGAAHPELKDHVTQLILIAPPVTQDYFPSTAGVSCPQWIVGIGELDEIVPVEEVRKWISQQARPVQAFYLPDTGHFFHGRLNLLKENLKKSIDYYEH